MMMTVLLSYFYRVRNLFGNSTFSILCDEITIFTIAIVAVRDVHWKKAQKILQLWTFNACSLNYFLSVNKLNIKHVTLSTIQTLRQKK